MIHTVILGTVSKDKEWRGITKKDKTNYYLKTNSPKRSKEKDQRDKE